MNQPAERTDDDDLQPAIEACGGDMAAALRAALISNAFLMEENSRLRKQVSNEFARGAEE